MDPETLDGIYQAQVQNIYRYLLSLSHDHHLAEDVTQETFLRAYLHLEDCPAEKVKPWLFRVAYNAFVDVTRKGKYSQPEPHEYFAGVAGGADPEEEVLRDERLRTIRRGLDDLPDKQRRAVLLVDFAGLTYAEAASALDTTSAYFKVLLFRARHKLRQLERG